MRPNNLSRRGFLAGSATALAATGLPMWYAREVVALEQEHAIRAVKSVNDKLQVGVVGCGDRVRSGDLLYALLRNPNVEVIACCDADAKQLEYTARIVEGEKPNNTRGKNLNEFRQPIPSGEPDPNRKTNVKVKRFKDYRDLVTMPELDAVLVTTPDHWHALPAIAACRAGKDVYCEKPLSLTIAEGRAMANAARMHGRVFQTGSQQRSELGKFRLACELVQNGRIGKIKKIDTRIGNPDKGGPFKNQAPPEGLDWNLWLGQTPEVPFCKERCHYQFRWWYAYSGGKMTDWGAHHNDVAQWALGMDNSGPVKVTAVKGEQPGIENGYDCHMNFEVIFEYANGVPVHCMAAGENGVRFEGENGWIFVSRGDLKASDPKIISEPLGSDAKRLLASPNHMRNFLDNIKSRGRCCADVEIGHRSATVCHLGNIALRYGMGKTLHWDPYHEQFQESDANQHVSRQMRAPWQIDPMYDTIGHHRAQNVEWYVEPRRRGFLRRIFRK
ncbi:MAG: Gfo/Idh/MocA family oxidoreductase [Planctomycetia bacterium]|nr:Gfo/Idh/MocA family oxidoreductase [Planctomycetia bacterium]